MMKTIRVFLACGLLLVVAWFDQARAGNEVADLGSGNVATRTPTAPGLGKFYVVQLSLPAGIEAEDVEEVYLEFYVDAASNLDAVYSSGQALLEVYALSGSVGTDITPAKLVSETRMVRNIRLGEDRMVRLNIGGAVRHLLNNRESNYGLVVGSLTGGRHGLFDLKRGKLAAGVDARVTYSLRDG